MSLEKRCIPANVIVSQAGAAYVIEAVAKNDSADKPPSQPGQTAHAVTNDSKHPETLNGNRTGAFIEREHTDFTDVKRFAELADAGNDSEAGMDDAIAATPPIFSKVHTGKTLTRTQQMKVT